MPDTPDIRLGLFNPAGQPNRQSLLYGDTSPAPAVPSLGIVNPSAAPPVPNAGLNLPPSTTPPIPADQEGPGLTPEEQQDMFARGTEQASAAYAKGVREREMYRNMNYMSTTAVGDKDSNYQFEGSPDHLGELRRQDHNANDPESAFLQPDKTVANPKDDSFDPTRTFRNIANFMFSDEMGLLGFKWDAESFTWNADNFINQITEHPYSSAFTLAAYTVPIGAAWLKAERIAQRGAVLAEKVGASEAAKGSGILGTNLGFQFDDHARLVQTLAQSTLNDDRKLFSPSVVDALKQAKTPDDVERIVPRQMLNNILIGDWYQDRFLELRKLAKQGQLNTLAQRASYNMWAGFGNKYMETLQETNKARIDSMNQFFNKAQFGQYLAAAPTRLDKDAEQAIYKYWTGIDRDYGTLKDAVGDVNAQFADQQLGRWKQLFQEQHTEGFIDPETYDKFMNPDRIGSEAHIPAVLKGTPGFEDLGAKVTSLESTAYKGTSLATGNDIAKGLSGPTMKLRDRFDTQQAVLDSIDALETNPRKLLIGGYIKDNTLFQIHRNFRDILMDAVQNPEGKWMHMTIDRDAYDLLPAAAKKQYMDFTELDKVVPGLSGRIQRMVDAKVANDGLDPANYRNLPLLDRNIVDQFFGGSNSARSSTGLFQRFWELLTSVHKTTRTALNPATHMGNMTGNLMFLSMAGMNPFTPEALNDGKLMTNLFTKIHNESKTTGATVEALMSKDNLIKHLGDDRYLEDHIGGKVDLADLFSSEPMKQLVEAQSFQQVEGLKHTKNILSKLEQTEASNWGDRQLATVARAIAGVSETPIIKPTLENLSAAYLAEDMVPKMMYSMNLARQGYGADAIVREVGRRLPQYRTVGNIPADARKAFLPWVTFPSEVARIMKNNMMDRPVQMMAWMQAPQIAQAAMSGMGMGPNYEDYADAISSAPPWAVRYSTVLANGNDAPTALSAVGGGAVGGLAGMATGGAAGAYTGAALGAGAGAALGHAFGNKSQDDLREFNRAWAMDFLPQSALFPTSLHPGEWEKVLPNWAGGIPTPGKEFLSTMKDLSPVEPFAVFTPLIDLFSGRGQFGQDIEAGSGIEMANKMALGMLGHLAPPFIQKYGMNLQDPGGALVPMGNILDNNGGMLTLPKHVTATAFGLAAAGLTFLGATKGLGAPVGAALKSAALAGGVSAMAGAEVNTRRLMTDLGIMDDSRTQERGDWTMDFLANSFFGVNKSWKATPQQQAFNDSLRAKRFAELRNGPIKEFRDAIASGRESDAMATLGELYKTYVYENGDTESASGDFLKSMQSQIKAMQGLPIYAGINDDRLKTMIAGLMAANAEKSKVQRQKLAELRSEWQQRQLRKAVGLKVVDQKE